MSKVYRALWKSQGILAILVLILGFVMDGLMLKAFYIPGNKEYMLTNYILPSLIDTVILILIIVGSFKIWEIALILNLLTLYMTIKGIMVYFQYLDSNTNLVYIDTVSHISTLLSLLMNLSGVLLLIFIFYNRLSKKS